jgi:hypothetical protein
VLALEARWKETRRMGQAGATGLVAMAAWQAGRHHLAPVHRAPRRAPAALAASPRPMP